MSRQAEMSFLALIVLHYRERNEGLERDCYDILTRWRPELHIRNMRTLKDKIRTEYLKLMDRRLRKARTLCEKENIEIDGDRKTRLKAKNHLDCDFFSEEGLHQEEEIEEVDDGDNKDEVFVKVPSSRLTGVFVSGSVVNLSCKSLTEDQIKLLSRGLKFSPTPRDIDKSQLKLDIEEFKRKMRLKWYFRDNNNNDSSLK